MDEGVVESAKEWVEEWVEGWVDECVEECVQSVKDDLLSVADTLTIAEDAEDDDTTLLDGAILKTVGTSLAATTRKGAAEPIGTCASERVAIVRAYEMAGMRLFWKGYIMNLDGQ